MGVFHVVGMSFLWLFQVSRTVGSLQHGVDGELTPGGTAVELNVRFLHYFCRHRQYQQYTVQVSDYYVNRTFILYHLVIMINIKYYIYFIGFN